MIRRDDIARMAGVLLVVLAAPSAASAETNGVKMGTGRVHFSLGLSGSYDSRVAIDDVTGEPGDEVVVHVLPGLSYDSGGRTVAMSLRARGDLNTYTGLLTPTSRRLTYFGGDLDFALDINEEGAVGLVLADRLAHSDRNSAIGLGSGTRSILNELTVKLPIRPGGGALEITPSYTLSLEAFLTFLADPVEVTSPQDLNYVSHQPGLQGKWRFLPKTAVIVDVRGDIRRYPGPGNIPVNALYARAGISGLVTPKLSVVLNAGYGNSFVGRATGVANYESVIGQAEIAYIPSPTARMKLGYSRSFDPVPQLAWFGNNRVYLGGSAIFAGRVLFEATGSFDLVEYASVGGGARRVDTVTALDLRSTVRITDWLNAGAGYRLEGRASGAVQPYARHVIDLAVTARY